MTNLLLHLTGHLAHPEPHPWGVLTGSGANIPLRGHVRLHAKGMPSLLKRRPVTQAASGAAGGPGAWERQSLGPSPGSQGSARSRNPRGSPQNTSLQTGSEA